MSGKFIVIDGIEGSGKSTQIKFIKQYLKNKGFEVILTREPGGTEFGEELRNLLLNNELKINAISELLIIFAARYQHINEKIIPAINDGKIVISDRFVDSSYAYQGGGRELDNKIIDTLAEITLGDFSPDLTIFLNLPLDMAMRRVGQRGNKDRIEKENLSFFAKVYNGYQQRLKNNPNIKNIDSSKSISNTQQQIANLLDKL